MTACLISTHTPLAGRDRLRAVLRASTVKFLLTRPSRGATKNPTVAITLEAFLLTRPSRGATISRKHILIVDTISTHTPLAGRDPSFFLFVCEVL